MVTSNRNLQGDLQAVDCTHRLEQTESVDECMLERVAQTFGQLVLQQAAKEAQAGERWIVNYLILMVIGFGG
jgi:hypothetical protein